MSSTASFDSPYALSFSVMRSGGRQSNALDRSINIAATYSFLSKAFIHSSVIASKTDWQLKPFRNAERYGSKCFSKCSLSCPSRARSKSFDVMGKILMGLKLHV